VLVELNVTEQRYRAVVEVQAGAGDRGRRAVRGGGLVESLVLPSGVTLSASSASRRPLPVPRSAGHGQRARRGRRDPAPGPSGRV